MILHPVVTTIKKYSILVHHYLPRFKPYLSKLAINIVVSDPPPPSPFFPAIIFLTIPKDMSGVLASCKDVDES